MYEEQKVERKKRIYLSGTDLRDRDHGHFNGCGSTFLQLYPGEICQTGSSMQEPTICREKRSRKW